MKKKCPACEAKLEIRDPAAPSPHGVVTVECTECHAHFQVDNPEGDDAHTVTEDVVRPGLTTLTAGTRISRTQAAELGLREGEDS